MGHDGTEIKFCKNNICVQFLVVAKSKNVVLNQNVQILTEIQMMSSASHVSVFDVFTVHEDVLLTQSSDPTAARLNV